LLLHLHSLISPKPLHNPKPTNKNCKREERERSERKGRRRRRRRRSGGGKEKDGGNAIVELDLNTGR
jgi:hypothetical protein